MKKLILASLALLVVAAGPAMAGEFQALSKLSVPGQTALKVMTDDQLAAVEGQRHRRQSGKVIDLTKMKLGETVDMMQRAAIVSANIEG